MTMSDQSTFQSYGQAATGHPDNVMSLCKSMTSSSDSCSSKLGLRTAVSSLPLPPGLRQDAAIDQLTDVLLLCQSLGMTSFVRKACDVFSIDLLKSHIPVEHLPNHATSDFVRSALEQLQSLRDRVERVAAGAERAEARFLAVVFGCYDADDLLKCPALSPAH